MLLNSQLQYWAQTEFLLRTFFQSKICHQHYLEVNRIAFHVDMLKRTVLSDDINDDDDVRFVCFTD